MNNKITGVNDLYLTSEKINLSEELVLSNYSTFAYSEKPSNKKLDFNISVPHERWDKTSAFFTISYSCV